MSSGYKPKVVRGEMGEIILPLLGGEDYWQQCTSLHKTCWWNRWE